MEVYHIINIGKVLIISFPVREWSQTKEFQKIKWQIIPYSKNYMKVLREGAAEAVKKDNDRNRRLLPSFLLKKIHIQRCLKYEDKYTSRRRITQHRLSKQLSETLDQQHRHECCKLNDLFNISSIFLPVNSRDGGSQASTKEYKDFINLSFNYMPGSLDSNLWEVLER